MFDRLKRFMSDIAGESAPREFREDDYRLAAVALLIHLASADGTADDAGSKRLQEIVKKNFGLDAQATAWLIQSAKASDRDAVDFYHFTHVLCRALDQEGRQKIIEMMWEIAFAGGTVDEVEENIIARIAELLGVSSHDRVRLRHRAAAEPTAEFPGPWSATPDAAKP